MNLLENFPAARTPRDKQVECLIKIQKAIKDDKKYIICNAPTGVGKSFISATVANASKDPPKEYVDWITSYTAFSNKEKHYPSVHYSPFGAAVLTMTKNLQNQYIEDFNNASCMKGKTNYICNYDNDYDIETAPCIGSPKLLKECWNCDRCFYYNARNETLINKMGVYSYSSYINLVEHVKYRQFVVCDEASELEDELVSQYTVQIIFKELEALNIKIEKLKTEDPFASYKWLISLKNILEDLIKEYVEKIKNKDKAHKKNVHLLSSYVRIYKNIEKVTDNWIIKGDEKNSTEYIVELSDKDNKDKVVFTPLKANKISRNLFAFGDIFVFLSATIIDPDKYMEDLGIPKDKAEYIEVSNAFDAKKSPIYVSDEYKLTYKTIEKNLPKVIKKAKTICDHHKDEKGLIHTVNFKITNKLKETLKEDRYLYRDILSNNEKLIKDHTLSTEPTVIISPSMSHGVDLKGDLGRFQIIMKVPFLPLYDKRIKRLCNEDKQWYINKTLNTIVQMCGRCTRTDTDEAVTYIIDGSIKQLLIDNWTKLPKHFRDRIK